MSKEFKKLWKGMQDMIADEETGEEKYRDIAETFDEMADDEAEHKAKLEGINKAENNPWAICHAQGLEGEKFESCVLQIKEKLGIKKEITEKDFNISNAGSIPNSKLAEQDLEGEARKSDVITNTQEKLEEIKEKTEDPKVVEEKQDLVSKMKEIQIKRQKATIKQREPEMVGKTFKEMLNKK